MTTKTSSTRTFARRDSATAFLKKSGIKRESYDKLIVAGPDAKFTVNTDELATFLGGAKEADKPAAIAKPGKKLSVAQLCLTLFLDGKTNKEVWQVLQRDRQLGEGKEHYPAWYRGYFRRTGKLPRPVVKPKAKRS